MSSTRQPGIIDSSTGLKREAGTRAASISFPVETRSFRRVGVEKGGGTAGRAKSARVMPGDLSGGQFVIVCQPLYTVNTTNCRLIQMRTERVEFARCLSASSLETRRVSKFRLVHVSLLIRPINLRELLLPFHLFVPLTIRHLRY